VVSEGAAIEGGHPIAELTVKWARKGLSEAEPAAGPALESATADELFGILDDESEPSSWVTPARPQIAGV